MRSRPTYKVILEKCADLFFKNPERYGGGRGPGVKTCHIAHALEEHNLPKRPRLSEEPRKYPCPPSKRHLISDVFTELGMLP